MRTKKRTPDFGAISRSSIKKDFQRVQRYPAEEKRPQIEEMPKINAERRIIHISEVSGYAKFARYIVGKLVRLKEKANVGGNSWYCEFVHDDDRKALNMAAGWSDNKKFLSQSHYWGKGSDSTSCPKPYCTSGSRYSHGRMPDDNDHPHEPFVPIW